MFFLKAVVMVLTSAGLTECFAVDPSSSHIRKRQPAVLRRLDTRQNKQKEAAQTCLAINSLQTASAKTGQEAGTDGIKPGQAPSPT